VTIYEKVDISFFLLSIETVKKSPEYRHTDDIIISESKFHCMGMFLFKISFYNTRIVVADIKRKCFFPLSLMRGNAAAVTYY